MRSRQSTPESEINGVEPGLNVWSQLPSKRSEQEKAEEGKEAEEGATERGGRTGRVGRPGEESRDANIDRKASCGGQTLPNLLLFAIPSGERDRKENGARSTRLHSYVGLPNAAGLLLRPTVSADWLMQT